jgi:hypothetical protein
LEVRHAGKNWSTSLPGERRWRRYGDEGETSFSFCKDSGLEIDFVIRWRGECALVEVKAETGNAKSAATILKHPEKYHVNQCIKLGNYNVGRSGKILTLPLYMGFLLYEV